jgi:hypothetical protein
MSLQHDGGDFDDDTPQWLYERWDTINRLREAFEKDRKALLEKNIALLKERGGAERNAANV